MTVAQLKEVGKLASKVIRKVPLENILIVHEVASYNPLFRLLNELQAIKNDEDGLITRLTKKCEKASMVYSD